jgi:hypothetical protein
MQLQTSLPTFVPWLWPHILLRRDICRYNILQTFHVIQRCLALADNHTAQQPSL